MDNILRGPSDESVWLKSLVEHDNVDKFVQLTCSASDFNHTISSQIPFILHHKNTMWLHWNAPLAALKSKIFLGENPPDSQQKPYPLQFFNNPLASPNEHFSDFFA